ncbi:hypothetical protein [Microbacterium hydrocarbonoxydans]|uniref:hypothetical protein n=1 Tax=Microbacterium hydrocarbonoxydans TaxID=273678 RepID=UPI00203E769F|nr:hypothetical protein [Microbacterium hydrocarbonoxydans]MCM3778739.1 hypothetical protein [Microbacterium hydrocarbonoxydans]
MTISRRAFLTAAAASSALALLPTGRPDAATAASSASALPFSLPVEADRGRRLTNLAHLRFLLAEVPVAASATHTTFGIESDPRVRAPWTYAESDGAGGYRPVGGGTRDAVTGYWTQGAYNADDIARAAVVFLRDWKASGDVQSRDEARDVLRSLAFLQTVSGPNAGRVVLWQQEDGTLNPSAIPVELPDPSDSAESYWLARTVWAFGEGYAAFAAEDAAFAAFLLERLHLCLDALSRESLSRAGRFVRSDGRDLPAWLIAGGADATAEAMLGLAAAAEVGDQRSRDALSTYGEAVAAMATDPRGGWPFGAVLPWTGSLGFWHAWGAAAPEALGRAGALLRRRDWIRASVADAGTFTPQVLASGGPHNAWAPLPAEAQIAYGGHGRVAGALAAAAAGGGEGLRLIAGLAAGWFFGANTAGQPVYDPATGVTFDGVETDGRINRNSGAESTIHGLLTMLLLDANRDVAALATSITGLSSFSGLRVLEAESARLSAGCIVERPAGGAWTGEGNLSGGAFVRVPAGETVEFDVTEADGILHALIWQRAADAGDAVWEVFRGSKRLWSTRTPAGGTGDRGLTEADGMLVPQRIGDLPGDAVVVRCTSRGDVRLDALVIQPAVATAVYATSSGSAVLYAEGTGRDQRVAALAPGAGRAYEADGSQRGQAVGGGKVRVRGGGFTVTR